MSISFRSIVLAAAMLTLAGVAGAATFTVTKTNDTNDGACDADCSLREAIVAANSTAPPLHTIVLPAGTYRLTIPNPAGGCLTLIDPACESTFNENQGASGDLDLRTSFLTIEGAGADVTTIEQTVPDRVLHVHLGVVGLRDVRVTGGDHGGYSYANNNGESQRWAGLGGGILVEAAAVAMLDRVQVDENHARAGFSINNFRSVPAGGVGGGIAAEGSVDLDGTAVVFNSVEEVDDIEPPPTAIEAEEEAGSGVAILSGGELTALNTTIGANFGVATLVSQLYVYDATAELSSVTLFGGGVPSIETANRTDETPAPETTIAIANSIIAGAGCSPVAAGQVTSGGWNVDQDATCDLDGPSDLTGAVELGTPALHGGTTTNYLPAADSPAVDSGAACDAIDQRGIVRPQDGDGDGQALCDRGAVEAEPGSTGCSVASAASRAPFTALALVVLARRRLRRRA